MAGCHCSLGVCAGTAYTFAVWFGCFAFILWGCHCDDPEHGYPNDWNRIYIAKEKLTDTGYYVHKCDLVGFAALFGLEWCIAIGASVSANLYISLPVLAFLVYYYGWRVAAKSLLLAVLAAAYSTLRHSGTVRVAANVWYQTPPHANALSVKGCCGFGGE